MISIKNLSFSFFNSDNRALDDVSLEIGEGQFVAVTGPSGCGKSTLAMAIGGYIPHVVEGKMEGTVAIGGHSTADMSLSDMATLVGIVQQDPEAQLCTIDVDDEVAFGPENLALPRDEVIARRDWALALVGGAHLRGREIYGLSGGEKQRVAIASMLAMRPRVLILDEPTSNLDPTGTAEVLAAIGRLRREEGLTVLVIEHKLGPLMPWADRLIVMEGGHIAMDGPPSGVLDRYRERLKAMGIRLPARRERDDACASGSGSPATGPEAVAVEGLRSGYDGKEVLHGVSFRAFAGEIVGIIGPNGSGKTTFLAHLLGMIRPVEGSVRVLGRDARGRRVSDLARDVGYVFQNPNHQIFERTVKGEAGFACANFGVGQEERDRRVAAALERFGLTACADRHPLGLSFGEKRRLNICSVLPHEPRVLVLDEPFVGQDYYNVAVMARELNALKAAGRTVLMVSHDIDMIFRHCDRIALFAAGRIIVDAPPEQAMKEIKALGMDDYLPEGCP